MIIMNWSIDHFDRHINGQRSDMTHKKNKTVFLIQQGVCLLFRYIKRKKTVAFKESYQGLWYESFSFLFSILVYTHTQICIVKDYINFIRCFASSKKICISTFFYYFDWKRQPMINNSLVITVILSIEQKLHFYNLIESTRALHTHTHTYTFLYSFSFVQIYLMLENNYLSIYISFPLFIFFLYFQYARCIRFSNSCQVKFFFQVCLDFQMR